MHIHFYTATVVMFEQTDLGLNLSHPTGKCRFNDEVLLIDCTAHSIIYDINANSFRPLMVQTDVWCSSAAVSSEGVLIQTGGYHNGDNKIRTFSPCNDQNCDWVEELGI
ncbi:hypothetical protein Leryth_021111 [Lithospermum erythrorhizon]|nr:hypothetical protein Leryth_021111 [Lithospermum erythrorhizon]